jgi:hypothetical protein
MTLPEQSDRAVAATREFLVRLASPYGEGAIKGIRREVRAEALALLRHYPLSWNGDCPDGDNAANEDKVFPKQTVTLTDAEREAIEECIKFAFPASHQAAATLRGLLERLA